jgi:hypothetical protein
MSSSSESHGTHDLNAPAMSAQDELGELFERLRAIFRSDDHKRGCQGREYSCSCGYDARIQALAEEAAAALTRLIAERDGLAGHVEQLVELLDIIKEHWIDYDHVYSIAVHEARTALSLDTKKGDGV